jgi:VWFA-related protein
MRQARKLALLGVSLATALAFPGTDPARGQGFVDKAEVFVVDVPVQVTKDGAPVRGLTAADFEVFEGRKKLPVTAFEVADLAKPAASMAPMAPAAPGAGGPRQPLAGRRYLLLLFDLSSSEPHSIVRARTAARDQVLPRLHPSDLVGVATYTASRGPQLALSFTSDRRQVEKALDSLGLPQLIDRSPDPLRLTVGELRGETTSGGPAVGTGMRAMMEQQLLTQLEAEMRSSEKANSEAQKAQLTAFTRSLSDFAQRLAVIPGRKQVVFLSEGFDSSLLLGTTDQARLDEMRESSMSGEYWKVDSNERYGSTEAGNDLEKLFESMRRSDCVIQSVDIGGLRAQGALGYQRPQGQDGLFLMARETGGDLVRNFNDLGEALGKVLERTELTYVLTVQPDPGKRDGGFRKLRVEVKNASRGTQVSAKAGYFAPRPTAAEGNPLERALSTAGTLLGGDTGGAFPLAVWAAPFRLPQTAAAYVPVILEVDGPGLAAKTSGNLPAEIYVYALAENGEVTDSFSQTIALDLAKIGPALRASGLKFFAHLDLPPGTYSLRTLVRNGSNGRLAVSALPLVVPAGEEPLVFPLLVPEAPGRWVTVREAPRGKPREVPYPFLVEQQPFIPSGLPTLEGGKEVAAVVFADRLAAGDVRPEVAIVGADGKEVGKGEIRLAAREAGGAGGPDRFKATVKLPALSPGDYVMRLRITDSAGASRSSRAAFHVGGRS